MAAVARRKVGVGLGGSGLRSFSGSVATTGNSRGFRLEKALFQAAPEFGTVGSSLRADLIGPGTMLVRVHAPSQPEEEDPIIGAWLGFLDRDIQEHPSGLVPLGDQELAFLETAVEGVVVDDDEKLPDDVTF